MMQSMTGYGRFQQLVDGMDIVVEIKSVNHRYFEYTSRLPRAYGFLDDKLKACLQTAISRGKVDVYVSVDTVSATGSEVLVNEALAEGYLKAYAQLARKYSLPNNVSVTDLARIPDLFTVRKTEDDEEKVWHAVSQVAEQALRRFVDMRRTEGARLREDVLQRAHTIAAAVTVVEEQSPQTVKAHMEKVHDRMQELLGTATVEESRLLTEAALFADKIATAEETVRLRSHLEQLEQLLDEETAIGRKLDFLVQEIGREVNTIGSKAQDAALARLVVDSKAELEKIREQIQNIE